MIFAFRIVHEAFFTLILNAVFEIWSFFVGDGSFERVANKSEYNSYWKNERSHWFPETNKVIDH
ncbi:hypothetical protein BpHYR1_026146 [Brachionus plicatilis]|uniref:Uncharacterized protein n=1 Tax=Brachionus plicatilis TaxID=10195 RepID=A0A3M7T7S0_BRAPC|nr:hypothetical protein BpHYR1_026146 [Brachionus plicatilis]